MSRNVNKLIALGIDRTEMTDEEHKNFIKYWYKRYETEGFLETFISPYEQYKDRIGQRFEVIRQVPIEGNDLECLPRWVIRFEDGFETEAWPEEICKLEQIR